jgi:Suppressor of fused protein (SUFU)
MNVPTPICYPTEISHHLSEHFGDNSFVLHEDKSAIVHVDLHVVRPSVERPYFMLLTSGMSDLDMQVPAGAEDFALAEVCLCLPSDWPLAVDSFGGREPQFFWPIYVLMQAARYAHREKTWLCWGHSIGGSEQPKPIDPQVEHTCDISRTSDLPRRCGMRRNFRRPPHQLPRTNSATTEGTDLCSTDGLREVGRETVRGRSQRAPAPTPIKRDLKRIHMVKSPHGGTKNSTACAPNPETAGCQLSAATLLRNQN